MFAVGLLGSFILDTMDFQSGRARGGGGGRWRGRRPDPGNVAGFRQLNPPDYGDGACGSRQGLGSGRGGYYRQSPTANYGRSGYYRQAPTANYGRGGDDRERDDAPRQAMAAPYPRRGGRSGRGGHFEYAVVRSPTSSSMSNGSYGS